MDDTEFSLLIGGYTDRGPGRRGKRRGIQAAEYRDGTVGDGAVVAELPNPSWVTATHDGTRVYAVVESSSFGNETGGVAAYVRDVATGALTLLNTKESGGSDPAHLALHPSGRFLLAANYSGGSLAVFTLAADGSLGGLADLVQHAGASVDPERQEGPHPHQLAFDPVDGRLLVPDLGVDAVLSYGMDDAGRLAEEPARRLEQAPGSGPRHLTFSPDGSHLFLATELNNTLVVYRRDGGRFVQSDSCSTIPRGPGRVSSAAAVRVSPSGRAVLVSNRGLDTIAVCRFDEARSAIIDVKQYSTLGGAPRDFVFSPDGRFVLVANQDSDTIVTFAYDDGELSLTPVSTSAATAPVCLVFVPSAPSV